LKKINFFKNDNRFLEKNEINITREKSQQINYQLKPHHKSVEQI